ncbi:MAG: lamin tail domain-containing protein [Planctomycetes bacterium]|nr:lamin tail domain-containing protein [Planctomycetota bacterium]
MLASILALACLQGPVVINEFSYDDSGTDDREYIEVYNPSSAAISLAGWKVESRDANGTTASYTLPATASVPSQGFLTIGSGAISGIGVSIGSQDLFPNDNDGLYLVDTTGAVIDAVIYETNKGKWPAAAPYLRGEGVWGNHALIDNFDLSWQLPRDGLSFNNSRAFHLRPWTPGKTNRIASAIPYADNFDAGIVGSDVTGWAGSFRHPKYIDPTVADADNPNAITASPQGGKAAIFWDNSGGGNAHVYLSDWSRDLVVEAYVYFDAKLEATGYQEAWSVGIQGCCGTYYNLPDPVNGGANGNTGISATFIVNDTEAALYLIDHNDGASGATAATNEVVLGKIVLKAGIDDGWKRLRLSVSGNQAELFFGGTYGCGDGQRLAGTVSAPAFGGVYVGYREYILDNKTTRPFTCDQMDIHVPTTSLSTYGTAKATTVGTPEIGANGQPVIGYMGFAITGDKLVPAQPALVLLGAQKINVDLGPVGGQSGAFLLTAPLLIGTVLADAQGQASLPVPIPCDKGLLGVNVLWQILDVDPALAIKLPFGTSMGLETKLGN